MVFGFIIFGNIGTNVLFPWLHKHFHHWLLNAAFKVIYSV